MQYKLINKYIYTVYRQAIQLVINISWLWIHSPFNINKAHSQHNSSDYQPNNQKQAYKLLLIMQLIKYRILIISNNSWKS